MSKGIFITFEGIDGSGKTTAARRTALDLERKGRKVVYTCEPSESWIGDAVKKSFSSTSSPFVELFLFLADRAAHTARIKDWLDTGYVVLCDRYADSTSAYQSVTLKKELRDMGKESLEWLVDLQEPFVLEPDLTILFDVDPAVSLKRLKRTHTKFEKLAFLEEVRESYDELAKSKKRFVKLDASKSLEEVCEVALKKVLSVIR